MAVESVSFFNMMETVCAAKSKYGVYVAADQYSEDEKSAGRFNSMTAFVKEEFGLDTLTHILAQDLLLFDTLAEAHKLYSFFNDAPFYSEEYACLIDPDLGIVSENT